MGNLDPLRIHSARSFIAKPSTVNNDPDNYRSQAKSFSVVPE